MALYHERSCTSRDTSQVSAGYVRVKKSSRQPSRPLKNALAKILIPFFLVSGTAFADTANTSGAGDKPLTIDDLGFSGVMNEDLFTSRVQVSSITTLNSSAKSAGGSATSGVQLRSMMELASDGQSVSAGPALATGTGFDLNGDHSPSDGISIRRFSTSVENSVGTLTVGSDWSNFQDFLGDRTSVLENSETVALGAVTANQVRWNSRNGLGVAIEQDFSSENVNNYNDESGSPSLVLSWQGASESGNGQYRMSALGRQVETDQAGSAEDKGLGWGLNLAGGWRFGDLFAKLSLTLGNSIDSFILGRFSDNKSKNTSAEFGDRYGLNEAFSFSPSIAYQLSEKGNLHFAVNRFQSAEDDTPNGVDTLDTVHLGYSWTPWPSTRFGIEYVGKDVEGSTEIPDSNEVNFAASKQF